MPDIARLDEDGLLIAVETVSEDEHVTDIAAGKFALPHNHDMRLHIKNYRWDVRRGHFVPLSMEPLQEEERATPELVEGIVEALEDIYEKLGNKSAARRAVESASAADLVMPERSKRVFEQFRRHVPRRKPQTIEISSARIAAAEASLANNPPATGGEATAATKPENRADLSTAKGKP